MSKYSDLVSSFFEDYERPTVGEYILGFSGLDPDKRIKPEEINHEELDGLLGGGASGHYHITYEQLQKLKAYEGQLSALQASLTAKIKEAQSAISEAEKALGARVASTENAQTTLADNQSTIAGAVSGLQNTARDLSQRMTSAENAQTALAASQKTLTAATEYIDAEEKKLAVRMTAAENAHASLQAGHNTLSGQVDTLNNSTNALAGRVSKTETAQASLEETQEHFAVRLDNIQENATTDTEILDARVDAENTVHQTLGQNVRALHRFALDEAEREHEAERDIAEYAREMSDTLAETVLDTRERLSVEMSERKSADKAIQENLSGIADDVDDLTDRTYALEYGLEDETSDRMSADKALSKRIDTVQGDLASEISQRKEKDSEIQADLNRANVSIAETIAGLANEVAVRKRNEAEISGKLEGEISDRIESEHATRENASAIFDYAREQSDINAGMILSEIIRRKDGEAQTASEIERVEADSFARDERLRVQAENELGEECSQREKTDAALYSTLEAEHDYAREQSDILAGILLEAIRQRREEDIRLAERIIAENLARVEGYDTLQGDISATREKMNASDEYLRGGLDDLSGALLALNGRLQDKLSRLNADVVHEVSRNETEHERLSEDIASNAEGVMSLAGTFADYAGKRRAEHDHETAQQVERYDEIRNDISDLASGVVSVAGEIARSNEYIRNVVEHERITRSAENDRLNEESQQLAAGLADVGGAFLRSECARRAEHENEREIYEARYERLNDDVEQLAAGITQNAATVKGITDGMRGEISHELGMLKGEIDALKQQANENALASMNIAGTLQREKIERSNAYSRMEAEADLAAAVLTNTRLIYEKSKGAREYAKATENHYDSFIGRLAERLQGQANDLAFVCLDLMRQVQDVRKALDRVNAEIASGLEGSADNEEIQESIDDIFAGNMTVNTSGDDEFDSMINQIFNPNVNP